MPPPDKLKTLWETLNKTGQYELPDYDTFKADMADESKRKKLHESLNAEEFEVPAYEVFSSDIGFAPAAKEPAFDDSAIPTVTIPEPAVLTPEDRKAIGDKLNAIPEKYLTDPNFQNTFISRFSKIRGVPQQAVRDLFDAPLLQQQVLDMQDQYAKSNDPNLLYQLSNLHKRLGEDDKAAEAMSVADNATRAALPMVGGQDIVQPGNEMTYLGDNPEQQVPVGSDTKASEAMKGSADAISYMNFFTSAPTMIGHGIDKVARGFNTDVKKVSDIYFAAFDVAVGLGETAMGAMGATPHGGMFFAGFDAVSKLMPQKAAEWLSPASKLIGEHYQEKGEEVPAWAENIGAVTDFALLAGVMGLGNKGIKSIEKRSAIKDFANNWEKDVTPEMVESALKQVEQNQIEYADNPEQYRAFIVERAKKMVDDAQAGKEVLDAEVKAVEPYEPQAAPESLRTVPEGSDVRMGDKMGKLERGDDGSWYFVDGETQKSTQISVEDKFNPTEKLSDLGIEVLPDIPSDAIAKAMADAEQVGTVTYNGKEYFVSLGNKMNEADLTGDIVAERSSAGLTTRFDQRDAKSEKFMKDRKLAIINQFLRDKGLPERTELFEPWNKKKEAAKVEAPKAGSVGASPLKPIENYIGDKPKVDTSARNWNEDTFSQEGSDWKDGEISGVIHETPYRKTYFGGLGTVEAKSEYAIVPDTKFKGRQLLLSREVAKDGSVIRDWSAVGEYDGGNMGILESHRGKGAGTAFAKELIKKDILKPSIGYSPEGLATVKRAYVELSKEQANAKAEPVKQSELPKPAEVVVEAPKIEVVPEVEKVEPIRQLGTGANVYFETEKHRVNDSGKNGGVLLNVGGKESEVPIANIEFTNAADAVKIAERINRDYPKGVPDAVLLDKYIDGLKKELLSEKKAEPIKPKEEAVQKPLSYGEFLLEKLKERVPDADIPAIRAEYEKRIEERGQPRAEAVVEEIVLAQSPESIRADVRELLKKQYEDAVQKQSTNEGVLRQERPEVGLQEMEQGNAKPKEAPRETGKQPESAEKQSAEGKWKEGDVAFIDDRKFVISKVIGDANANGFTKVEFEGGGKGLLPKKETKVSEKNIEESEPIYKNELEEIFNDNDREANVALAQDILNISDGSANKEILDAAQRLLTAEMENFEVYGGRGDTRAEVDALERAVKKQIEDGKESASSKVGEVSDNGGVAKAAPKEAKKPAEKKPSKPNPKKVAESWAKKILLDKINDYNKLGKRNRNTPEAYKLIKEIQDGAPGVGYSIGFDKQGNLQAINAKGKFARRAPDVTPEQREARKRVDEARQRRKKQKPADLRQWVLRYFAEGGRMARESSKNIDKTDISNDLFEGPNAISAHDMWELAVQDFEVGTEKWMQDNKLFDDVVEETLAEISNRADAQRKWNKEADRLSMVSGAEAAEVAEARLAGYETLEDYNEYYDGALREAEMEAAKYGVSVDYWRDLPYEDRVKLTRDVDMMTKEEVESYLKELDENFPKTEEEIASFFEDAGIEPNEIKLADEIKPEDVRTGEKGQAEAPIEAVGDAGPPVKAEAEAAIKKAADALAAKIREGKINRPDMFLSSSPGAIAWDLALEAVSKTLEAAGTVAQAIADGIVVLRNSDWYKDLDKNKQKDAEQKFEDSFKESEPEPVKEQPKTEGETPRGPYGIKNEATAAENVALGLPENVALTNAVKQEWSAVVEEAGRSKINAMEVALEVSDSPRPLSTVEQAVMLKKKVELMNQDNAIGKQIIEAYESKKPGYENAVKTLLEERGLLRFNIQTINEAFALGGREMGRAFNFRKALMDADYSLAAMEIKWREAAKGKEMPDSVREKFEAYDKQIQELTEKYQKLEEDYNKKKLEEAFVDIQEAAARKPKAPKKQALTTDEILRKKQLTNKMQAKYGQFNDVTNIAKALADKEFYDWAGLVAKESLYELKAFTEKLVTTLGKAWEPYAEEVFEKVKPKKKRPVVEERVLESGETVTDIKLNTDFLLDLIEKGADTGEKLANAVHEIIVADYPDITLREVKDAISEYGKTINPSENPLRQDLSRIKTDLKLESGLEDAKAGLGVKRSGFQRPKPTDSQREMRRKISDELKKYPEDAADVQRKWATALDRTKSSLRNAIADLEKRIEDVKNGVATEKVAGRKAPLDQEALDLQAQRDMLKKELTDLEGKKGLTDEQRVKAAILGIERSMAEYKRRTEEINRTGTLTLKQKEKLDTPEIRDLRFYRDLEKQKYEQALKDNKIDEAIAINKALTNIENRIAEKERRILNKDFSITERVKKAYMDNPLIKAKQEQLKETNKILQEFREASGEAERHRNELYLKRLRERAAELQRKLDTGDFSKKVKPDRELSNEMIQAQAEIDRLKYKVDIEVEKERLKNRTGVERYKEQILDAINLPKSLLASMDLSAVLRQGAILSVRDPRLAARAWAEMGKQMKSQEAVDKWTAALHSMPEYGMMLKTKLFLSEETVHLAAKEELFGSSYAKRIPIIGRTTKINGVEVKGLDLVGGSERAYTAYLNQLRVDTWLKYYEASKNRGLQGAEMVKTMEAFSDFINNATGRANLGKLEKYASILNAVYFAPRYVASRFNLLNPVKYAKMPKQVRIEALRSMLTYIGTGYGILQLAKAAGAEVNLTDPTSSDFGKIKIGDTRMDIFAGIQQVVVLLSRLSSDMAKVVENQSAEDYDKQDTKIIDNLLRFSRTKSSPVTSFVINTVEGKNVVGEKTTAVQELKRMAIPLVYQDLYEIAQAEGVDALLYAAPMVLGVGVQNYVPKLPKLVEDGNVSAPAYKVMQQKGYVPRVSKLDKLKIDGVNVDITNKQNYEYQVKVAEIAGEIINNATDKPYKIKGTDSEIPALKNMPPAVYNRVMAKILQYSRMQAKNQVFGKGKWAPADKYTEQEIEEIKEYRQSFNDPRR